MPELGPLGTGMPQAAARSLDPSGILHRALRYIARQFEGKQLAQVELTDATATQLYSPAQGKRAVVRRIYIVAHSGTPTVTLYHDDNGTTYTNATKIDEFQPTPGTAAIEAEEWIALDNPAGNLAVQSSAPGGDVTVTIYGTETGETP